MITPAYLKKGDLVGIVAVARKISENELSESIKTFKQWGLRVELATNIYDSYHQFAGPDKIRIKDMQTMLDNPDIKAIFCARGGYGTLRIIDKLNFANFINNPKWIIGYSDITVLHSHIQKNFNIETIHGMMPYNFSTDFHPESMTSLYKSIFGEKLEYKCNSFSLNKHGESNAELVGGNLSILFSLNNSVSDLDYDGKILFIEDIDEYLYHIDRMLLGLKRANKLSRLAGLIIGGMTDMKDNTIPYGKAAYDIIYEHVREYSFPIAFNFPAGHNKLNLALIMGRKIKLSVTDKETKIIFESK